MKKCIVYCALIFVSISCDLSPNREDVTDKTFQKVLSKETEDLFKDSDNKSDAMKMKIYFIETASALNALVDEKTNGDIGGSQSYSFFLKEETMYNIVTLYKRNENVIVIKRTAFDDAEKYYMTSYFLHTNNIIIDVIRMDNNKSISFTRIGDINHLKNSFSEELGFTL